MTAHMADTPTAPGSRLARGYLLGLLAATALYLVTVAPGPLYQDSGLAQVRTLHRDLRGDMGLALAHPLYYCLTIAFQSLPLHESAFKTNLVSAVFGAITVANVLLLLRLLAQRWTPAILGAISVAIAHTFWQHCALAEVYTVTTALMTAELLCALRFVQTRRSRWLVLLFLANGLGISNHMFAALSAVCDAGLVIWAIYRRQAGWRVLPAIVLAWLVGASLYITLVVTEIRHGVPVTLAVRSALVGEYGGNVLRVVPSLRQLANSVLYLGLNFPTPAIVLALAALVIPTTGTVFRWYLFAEVVVFLVWAVRYDVPDQYTFFIPAIVLIGIWIGLGADMMLRRGGRRWLKPMWVAVLLPPLVYAPLPWIAKAAHLRLGGERQLGERDRHRFFLWPWKTGYDEPARLVQSLSESLPAGSILIADSTSVRPFWYAQATGEWPASIEVRPAYTGPRVPRDRLPSDDFQKALNEGRLYVISPVRNYCPDWLLDSCTFEPHGPVFRVIPARPATSSAPAQS